jgi:integrase/recombinase XerC
LGVITWALEIPNLKAQSYRDTKGPGRPAVRAMMEHCRARGDRKGVRDFALLRILFDLGLRRGEVVTLDLEHIDLEAVTVSILGKGRLQRETLNMPRATIDALRAWISERGTEPGPLFLSCDNARKGDGRLSSEGIYKTVRKIGKDVG